ncbi:hypothetical protein B0H14DRAFT_2356708, partial [Mycena olivaceomarginata]
LFFARERAHHIDKNTGPIVAAVNPGYCTTNMDHEGTETSIERFLKRIVDYFIARTAEMGSQTIIHAAARQGGKEQHGKYLSNCRVERECDYSPTEQGLAVQWRLWVSQFSVALDFSYI